MVSTGPAASVVSGGHGAHGDRAHPDLVIGCHLDELARAESAKGAHGAARATGQHDRHVRGECGQRRHVQVVGVQVR
jgi:hypothetical protein